MSIPFLPGAHGKRTLLLVTPPRLARADFSGGPAPRLTRLWQSPAPPDEPLPRLAEAAFRLGPASRAQTYVITSAVLTHLLGVTPAKVYGLRGDELAQALAFEAEPVSGLSPFESVLGAQPQGDADGEQQFWVTQARRTELDEVAEALLRHRADLAGVVHAGGLLSHLEAGVAGEPWQRLELWGESVFCLDASASGAGRIHLIASPGTPSSWMAEAEAWFTACGPSRHRSTLVPDPDCPGPLGQGRSLMDEAVLRAYLGAWARELALDRPRVPMLRPDPRPMATSTRWMVGGGLAAAAVALCGGHRLLTEARIRGLEADLKAARRPTEQFQALVAENAEQGRQLDQLTTRVRSLRALLEDWRDGVSREHRRHAALLEALTRHAPTSLMIESLSERAGELRLGGVSMTPESPGFANGDAECLEPFHWTLEPPRRRALSLAADGGPWHLQWTLRPQPGPDALSAEPPGPMAAQANPDPSPR